MKQFVNIYTLSDTKGNIRYVGKTKRKLKERVNQHYYSANNGVKTYLYDWLRSIKEKPVIELLDICEESEWESVEKYWISQFRVWGFKLVNLAEGGLDGSRLRSKNKKSKPTVKVIEYNKEGEFICIYSSIISAANKNKSVANNITRCCKKEKGLVNGSMWRYFTEDYSLNIEPYKVEYNQERIKNLWMKNRKFTPKQIRDIRYEYSYLNTTQKNLADSYGVSEDSIYKIINFKTYKDIKTFPCDIGGNGECNLCDCTLDLCAYDRWLNKDYTYETEEELDKMFKDEIQKP